MSSSSNYPLCAECRRLATPGQVRVLVTRNLDVFGEGDATVSHVECFDPYGFLFSLMLDEVVKLSVGA